MAEKAIKYNASDFDDDTYFKKTTVDGHPKFVPLTIAQVKTDLGITSTSIVKFTEAEWNSIDTSSFEGGEKALVVDSSGLTREFIWNNFTEDWG